MKVLAIDPGINGTGWAFRDETHPYPWAGIIKPRSTNDSWQYKIQQIYYDIKSIATQEHVNQIVCENMQFEQTKRGETSAKAGDIFKTQALVGAIMSVGFSRSTCGVATVEVAQWKGQTPKPIVEARICRELGCPSDTYKSHEWDAVGILLYWESLKK